MEYWPSKTPLEAALEGVRRARRALRDLPSIPLRIDGSEASRAYQSAIEAVLEAEAELGRRSSDAR